MKTFSRTWALATVLLAGCMAGGQPVPPQPPPAHERAPYDSAARPPDQDRRPEAPLLIDRTDLCLGTTVQFGRVPSVSELYDLSQLLGIAHIVLSLPAWPAEYAPLLALNSTPPGADVIVVLRGYPPNQTAAQVWGYVDAPLRIVVVVPGPPPTAEVVQDLNSMRSLERVIVEMERPSRSGFERLQRPLSFRKVME